VGLVLVAALVPTVSGQTSSSASGLTIMTSTLVDSQGAWVLIPVSVPVLACLLVAGTLFRASPPGGRRLAWLIVGVLAAFCLFAIASIGIFVLPVAALLAGAIALAPPAAPTQLPAKPQS
jgi:uncharacterized BrkB/YihY/UPF0761 family membrane protein